MLEVVVLVGLQASGKSTFARDRFAASHAIVSKDAFPNAKNKARRQAREIDAALSSGRSVLVDNTNPRVEDRAPVVAAARTAGARVIAYVFDAAFDECVERNAKREGRARVPDVGLRATAKSLVLPTSAEGFDEVWAVTGPFAERRIVRREP